MPRCASSSAPTLRSPPLASVPNSSISMRSGVIVAALTVTKGAFLRADSAWIARAASSLPEPDGPITITRLLVGATRSIVWRSWLMAADMPIRSNVSPLRFFRSESSRRSLEVSSARSAMRISRSALNGFSMKSYAPRRMAETAVSMVPWPEIITTGRPGCSVLISSRSSSPSRRDPCSQMSRKTSRGTRSEIAASALSASWAVRVSWPSSPRMPATSSRMSSSSSTIRMSDAISCLPGIALHRAGRRCRQDDADHGPAPVMKIGRRVVKLQPAAMVLDNLLDDGKAEAGALLARGHVGFEQPLAVLAWQALAVVDHLDHEVLADAGGADQDRALDAAFALGGLDRLGRVLDQVAEGLRKQARVEGAHQRLGAEIAGKGDVGATDLDEE